MVSIVKDRALWLLRGGSDSTGQTLVEYSMLVAFAASMIIAIGFVVGGTGGIIDGIGSRITDAVSHLAD